MDTKKAILAFGLACIVMVLFYLGASFSNNASVIGYKEAAKQTFGHIAKVVRQNELAKNDSKLHPEQMGAYSKETQDIMIHIDTIRQKLGLVGDQINERVKTKMNKVFTTMDKFLEEEVNKTGIKLPPLHYHGFEKGDEKTPKMRLDGDSRLHVNDSTETADELYNKVRVLCFVPCRDTEVATKGKVVMETWGKRCNKLIFFTTREVDGYPTVGLNITESGNYDLTTKIFRSFKYIYEHERNNFEWFVKADTDTYVVLENLRYMLSTYSASQPVYFGQHFQKFVKNGYMSGGAGYVLSRNALMKMVTNGLGKKCKVENGVEDLSVGRCLQDVGVLPGDSRDQLNRTRFHCMHPDHIIHANYPDWFRDYDKYGAKSGIESLSDYAITFHWLSKNDMYNLEYYIYHLRPYGIVNDFQSLKKMQA